MSLNDVRMRGLCGAAHQYRVAASATKGNAGEPVMQTPSYSSGIGSHTIIVCTTETPVVGTNQFIGVLGTTMLVNSSATVIAQKIPVDVPIPNVTQIEAVATTTTGYVDTDTDLVAILGDLTTFHLASSKYTINTVTLGNTGGLMIVDGNIAKGTLLATVDARALRTAIS